MKITYIKLKNVKNIYTALKAKEIEIDLSKSKNKIILLEGPNGSGKTTILSSLHPFATNGNLDVRSDSSIIIKGEEGYKELIIENGSDEYIIKHFYYPNKDTHTVKSYIMKNGIELNINGNVTSFKTIVENELDIKIDYLKLIRLGSNVTNFIDLKTTERKNFLGTNILDEVDIYLKYYKKVNDNLKEIKSVISHTVDKIDKLQVSNPDDLKNDIDTLNSVINNLKNDISSLSENRAIYTYELSKLTPEYELKQKLSDVIKNSNNINKIYNSKKFNPSLGTDDNINNLINEINKLKLDIDTSINKRNLLLSNIDTLYDEKNHLNIELKNQNIDEQIKTLEYIISDLKEKVDYGYKLFEGFIPTCTLKELETVINILENNQNILSVTYEFGKKPIKKVIKLIQKKENVNNFINDKISILLSNKLSLTSNYIVDKLFKKFPLIYPDCNNNKCKIYQLWNELYDISSSKIDNDVEDEEFYTFMSHAYNNIKVVFNNLTENKELFSKMPIEIKQMLLFDVVCDNISNCKWIYNKEILNDKLMQLTEYEIYQNNINRLRDAENNLINIKNTSNKSFIENRISVILEQIKNNTDIIEVINKSLISYNEKLNELEDLLKFSYDVKDVLDKKDIIDGTISKLTKEHKDIILYNKKIDIINDELNNKTFEMNKLINKVNSINYRINEYNSLTKDLEKLREDYDDIVEVRNSLSSKDGIPLLYIKVYLKNTKEITNDLLDIVYNGELKISNFNISSTEFKIPYITKSTIVDDIKYASQGEKSFVSLALSFALSYQSLTKYNIMLLDEIDSTLDSTNREKFIKILMQQMDMIQSEQNFLITHNNMFDMYPVDIISMTNNVNKNNKLANYIKIKMK